MLSVSYSMEDFEVLQIALQDALGVVVMETQRSDFVTRIEPLLASHRLSSLASLAASIQAEQSGGVKAEILNLVSLKQSNWALDADINDVLQFYIFAQLPDNARIWLVGCEQGQMAYSVAMEIIRFEQINNVTKNFRVIATDVSQKNINHAELASYSKQQLNSLSEDHFKLFITPHIKAGSGKIKKKLHELVTFSQCDLKEDFQYLDFMDLIICPSAMVYYSNDKKAGIQRRLTKLLKCGGILLTGSNGILLQSDSKLERVEHPAGVFYRKIN